MNQTTTLVKVKSNELSTHKCFVPGCDVLLTKNFIMKKTSRTGAVSSKHMCYYHWCKSNEKDPRSRKVARRTCSTRVHRRLDVVGQSITIGR